MSIEGVDYKLSWVICHQGSEIKSGHYVCYLTKEEENLFIELDDDTQKNAKMSQKMMREAYILGYEVSS